MHWVSLSYFETFIDEIAFETACRLKRCILCEFVTIVLLKFPKK